MKPPGLRYQTDYFYDANNNLVRTDIQNIDEQGVVQANSHFTTTTDYEVLNNPVQITQEVDESRTIVTEYQYDGNRNRTRLLYGEAKNGSQPQNAVTYLYDERNLVYKTIRAEGHAKQSTTRFDYDRNRNLIVRSRGIEDSVPRTTSLVYDLFDRLTSVVDPMGNVTTYGYDDNSNVTSVAIHGELNDAEGSDNNVRLSEAIYRYDALDRRVRIEQQFFNTETQASIGDGVALTTIDYTDISKPRSITNDNNHTTTYHYDSAHRLQTIIDAKLNTRTLGYDANSNVTTITEVDQSDLGSPDETFVTTNLYDPLDRLTQTTDNAGNINEYFYDSRDNLVVTLDALRTAPELPGNRIRYVYDGLNRLTETIRTLTDDGTGSGTMIGTITTSQGWDDSSRLVTQTDDNGNVTQYDYDSLNRRDRIIYADNTQKSVTYDAHDNAVTRSDANGSQVICQYDLNDRRIRCDITPGAGVSTATTFEEYAYDGLNRLILARDDDATVTRRYDSLSNRTSEEQNGQEIVSVYDGVGNVTDCTYPGGREITTEYDSLERKHRWLDADGLIAESSFFGPGRIERKSFKNGTRCDYGFDAIRRITATTHSRDDGAEIFDDRSYAWDRMHNKTAHNEVGGVQRDYGYDSAYRLTSSTRSDTGIITYNFDGVQNRTSVTGGDHPGVYTLDDMTPEPADRQTNQYTTTPFDSREYDANGNLVRVVEGSNTRTLTYDYRNRLVNVSDTAPVNTSTYRYDPLNRRIQTNDNGTITRYFYDGWQVCEEQDASNNTEATFIYGRYIDEPLQMQRGSNDYYYHADDLYNVCALTDATGNVAETYDYADYGKPTATTTVGNPYLFTGRRYDNATGLYYYRNRYAEPRSGTFLSRDPLGYVDSMNSRAELDNNPLSYLDPLGTKKCQCPNRMDGRESPIDPNLTGEKRLAEIERFARMVRDRMIQKKMTMLEAGSAVADYASKFSYQDNIDYLEDLGNVLAGWDVGYIPSENEDHYVDFGPSNSGFTPELDDQSNQLRHFIGAVIIGNYYGYNLGTNMLDRREWHSGEYGVSDYKLNEIGAKFGDDFSQGLIDPDQFGEQMRKRLGVEDVCK